MTAPKKTDPLVDRFGYWLGYYGCCILLGGVPALLVLLILRSLS